MSSDLADFYNQKRQNKAADREQDRLDRQAEREQNRVDAQARLELQAKQRREALAEAKRRKAERAKKWADRRAAVTSWLDTDADTAMVLPIMAVGMIAAITFQVDALTDAGFGRIFGGLPLMVALVLELGAAAATVMTVRAAKDGRPAGPFRVAMWTCALIAAGINAAHGWTMEIDGERAYWPAAVLFIVSLAGTGYWEMRSIGRHGTSRRTKAERAKDRARAKHIKDRGKTYKDVAARAREIVLAHPFEKVTAEQAWADAWMDIKGAPLGMYAAVYENRGKAQAATTKARAVANEAAMAAGLDIFLDSLLGGGSKGDDDPGASPAKGGPKRPPQTPTALGGLDERPSGRAPRKDATEDLAPADIKKAQEYLNLVGKKQFSAPAVAKLLGRSHVYARRIRNAVNENQEG
ncbi:hypothetical protein [Streptomyces sp. WM6349]|uniref:hypothetical protein n=1 Tax=Streptomyces sp. WM6349 TaxID=1415552 RepID=UPI00131B16F7|nr:hypothetical protein [Streptomyces sp. WM6349]